MHNYYCTGEENLLVFFHLRNNNKLLQLKYGIISIITAEWTS